MEPTLRVKAAQANGSMSGIQTPAQQQIADGSSKEYTGKSTLLPSYHLSPTSPTAKTTKFPTQKAPSHVAYVDGVRGVAALLVYVFHFTFRVYNTNLTYGVDPSEASTKDMGRANPQSTYDLIRLPVVRLLYSGAPMVALFFIISGYSLSHRPLIMIRASNGRDPMLLRHIAGATLRRPIRLFGPVVLSSLLVLILVRLHVWEWVRPIADSNRYFPVLPHETHVPLQPTILAQLLNWYKCMSDLLHNAFGDNFFGGNFDYDVHLWTIPVEFRSSLSLFLALVVSSCFSVTGRFVWWALLILWSFDGGKWEMILFYSGAALSELDLIRRDRARAPGKDDEATAIAASDPGIGSTDDDPICGLLGLSSADREADLSMAIQRHILAFMFMIFGLFLLSYPEELASISPGYGLISHLTPKSFGQPFRFWHVCGAMMFTYALSTSQLMQRPFTTGFAQYLGKISFGLYLMHGPVTHSLGYAVLGVCWDTFGDERGNGFEFGFGVGLLITTLLVIWAGHIWTRLVDPKVVRFSKWVVERFFI